MKKTKKTKTAKKSVKRKNKSTKKNSNLLLKSIIFTLLILIFVLGGFLAKLLLENKETKKVLQKTQVNLQILEHKVKKLEKELKEKEKKIIKYSEIQDYKEAIKKQKPQPKPTAEPKKPKTTPKIVQKRAYKSKPKLVIIIDDVAFSNQVRAIKSLPFKITPSFFPPTKTHPNTPIYARYFNDYMIHVPMEAISWNKPELNTLKTTSTYVDIYQRISELKADFPNALFINNHTGSKFTSDTSSMYNLFRVLRLQNLGFVDSKTTPNSKSKLAESKYPIPLYCRDIFLDNEENISYIHNQLKKAVRIAQKRGYAIAIGHPHSVTFKALRSAKYILKNVDVVTINELYRLQHEKN